jgi:hypothetical protein
MKITTCIALIASIALTIVSAVRPDDHAAAADSAPKKESTRVRYARAFLALTRLDLQVASARNAQVPNSVPKTILAVFEAEVALADNWLKEAESKDAGVVYNVAVKSAESLARLAQENYAAAVEASRIAPLQPATIERLRLKAELANLAVARARELDPRSPIAVLEYQMDRLREDVAELTRQQLLILDRN